MQTKKRFKINITKIKKLRIQFRTEEKENKILTETRFDICVLVIIQRSI